MTNNIGQYPTSPYMNNRIQGGFQGDIPLAPLTEKASGKAQDSQVGRTMMDIPMDAEGWKRFAPYLAATTIASIAIKKGLDLLCNPFGRYENSEKYKGSIIHRCMNWIDDNRITKGISQSIENGVSGFKKWVSGLPRFSWMEEVIEKVKKGAKPRNTMAISAMNGPEINAIEHFVGELRTLSKTTGLGDLAGALSPKKLSALTKALADETREAKAVLKEIAPILQGVKDVDKLTKIGVPRKISLGLFSFDMPKWNWLPDWVKTKRYNTNLAFNTIKNIEDKGAASLLKGLKIVPENRSILARLLTKTKTILGEAATGGIVGGGLFGIAMNALFIGTSLKKAMEEPKGKRLSKFMEEFLGNWVSFIITMPLIGKMFYHVTGLKYLGVKGGREAVQTAIKTLEKEIASGLSKADIAKRANDIRKMLKAKPQYLIQRPLKWFGRIIGLGLDKIPRNEGFLESVAKFRWFKGLTGGTLRFGIFMFLLIPLFSKPFIKLSHAIFGRPTKSILDEEKEEANQDKTNPQNMRIVPNMSVDEFKNLIKQQQVQQSQPVNNAQAIGSQDIKSDNDENRQSNKVVDNYDYLPSTDAVPTMAQKSDAMDSVLAKADKYASYAEKQLKQIKKC